MSQISTYPLNERWTITELSGHSLPSTSQAGPTDVVVDVSSDAVPRFDVCQFFDSRAGSAAASFYNTVHRLDQAPLVSMHLTYRSSFDREQSGLDLKNDIWVDMPPLFTRKVIMRACYTGQGEPLAILDPLPED